MTRLRQPPRLFEASKDPELRTLLRAARTDTPELSALLSLADRTTTAVHSGHVSSTRGSSARTAGSTEWTGWTGWKGLAKLTLISCSAGVFYLATQRHVTPVLLPAPEPSSARAALPEPQETT